MVQMINGKTNTQNKPTTNNPVSKSKNADLKSLKVNVEGMSPEFDKNTTEYYLIVDLSVEKIDVTATADHEKASVKVTGNNSIKLGENTININVTAEDGTVKKYVINVTKVDNVELADASLQSIEISNYKIYPTFKPDVYRYNLMVNNEIDKLDLVAKAEKENAKVEITGNENLKEGENIKEITVTAEDGVTVRKYRINTYVSPKKVELKKESKVPAIILIVILSAVVVALATFIIIRKRMYDLKF